MNKQILLEKYIKVAVRKALQEEEAKQAETKVKKPKEVEEVKPIITLKPSKKGAVLEVIPNKQIITEDGGTF
jgi:citrate lyase alpha subunit